jgi:hypothetical protein
MKALRRGCLLKISAVGQMNKILKYFLSTLKKGTIRQKSYLTLLSLFYVTSRNMDACKSMDASNRMSASNSMGVSNNWETRTGGTPGNADHTVGNTGFKINSSRHNMRVTDSNSRRIVSNS